MLNLVSSNVSTLASRFILTVHMLRFWSIIYCTHLSNIYCTVIQHFNSRKKYSVESRHFHCFNYLNKSIILFITLCKYNTNYVSPMCIRNNIYTSKMPLTHKHKTHTQLVWKNENSRSLKKANNQICRPRCSKDKPLPKRERASELILCITPPQLHRKRSCPVV